MKNCVSARFLIIIVGFLAICPEASGSAIRSLPVIDPQQGASQFALDGDALVYWGKIETVGSYRDLYVQPTDGSPRRKLFDSANAPAATAGRSAYTLSITKDGQTAVFSAPVDDNGEVAVYRAAIDGTTLPMQVTPPSGRNNFFSHALTNSESYLVHSGVFDSTGVNRVFATPFDGSGPSVALSPSSSDAFRVGIPPCSDQVVYRQSGKLYAGSVIDGSSRLLGEPVGSAFNSDFGDTSEAALFHATRFPLQRLYVADLGTADSLVRIDTQSFVNQAFIFGDTHAIYNDGKDAFSYEFASGQTEQLNEGLPDRSVSSFLELSDNRIAFGVSRGVGLGKEYYTQHVGGGDLRPLATGAPFDAIDRLYDLPTEDNAVLAKTRFDSTKRKALHLLDLSGGDAPQLLSPFDEMTDDPSGEIIVVDIVSASSSVVYGTRHGLTFRGALNDLYIASTDGSGHSRRLTDLPADHRIESTSISADGRWAVIDVTDYDIDQYDSGDTPVDAAGILAVDTLTGHLVEVASLSPGRLTHIHGFAGDTNRFLFTVFDEGEDAKSFAIDLKPVPEPTASALLALACLYGARIRSR